MSTNLFAEKAVGGKGKRSRLDMAAVSILNTLLQGFSIFERNDVYTLEELVEAVDDNTRACLAIMGQHAKSLEYAVYASESVASKTREAKLAAKNKRVKSVSQGLTTSKVDGGSTRAVRQSCLSCDKDHAGVGSVIDLTESCDDGSMSEGGLDIGIESEGSWDTGVESDGLWYYDSVPEEV